MASAPELLATLRTAEVPRGGTLLLDLAGVTFMDSTGIGALIEAHQQREATGVALSLVEVPPLIGKMLHITGVDEYLDASPKADGRVAPEA